MSDPFVGFQQSPKPDPRAQRHERKFNLEFEFELKELLQRLTSRVGFEKLFGETKKFDFRQGAKLQFSFEDRQYRGTVSQINIPKRIVLNTEIHGEMEFQFSTAKGPAKAIVLVRSNMVPEQVADWESDVAALIERFREV